jgi:lysophospholipase L1-like esterase
MAVEDIEFQDRDEVELVLISNGETFVDSFLEDRLVFTIPQAAVIGNTPRGYARVTDAVTAEASAPTIPTLPLYESLPDGVEGDEAFVSKIQASDVGTRKLFFKREATLWSPGINATDLNYIASHPMPAPDVLPTMANFTFIAPGSCMTMGSPTVANTGFVFPLTPGDGTLSFDEVVLTFYSMSGNPVELRRLYVGPLNGTTVTENYATGFITVVSSPVTVSAGTADNPSWQSFTVSVPGGAGSFAVVVELGANSELSTWTQAFQDIGFDQTLLGREARLNVVPSSGTFNVTSTASTFSQYPNMSARVNNLSSNVGTVIMNGDSHIADYSTDGDYNNRRGVAYRYEQLALSEGIPVRFVQIANDGLTTLQIKNRTQALLSGPFMGARLGLLQVFSINNFTAGRTAAQAKQDYLDVEALFGGQPTLPALYGVNNAATAPQWTLQQDVQAWSLSRRPDTLDDHIGVTVNGSTGQWINPYGASDGAHATAAGQAAQADACWPSLRGWLASVGVHKPLVPLRHIVAITGGQDFQASLNNDGSLWFWSGGGDGTMQADVINIETMPITSVELLVENINATGATMRGFSLQVGGTWYQAGSDVVPPAGGEVAAVKQVRTNVLSLGTVWTSGATARLAVSHGSGMLTNARTFGSGMWADTGRVSGMNFAVGRTLNAAQSGGVGIGPFPSTLFGKYSTALDPMCNIVIGGGDSTYCSTRPLAAANSNSKEGLWFYCNEEYKSAGQRVRIYDRANGTFDFDQIVDRFHANLNEMEYWACLLGFPVWTWNSAISGSGAIDYQWDAFLLAESTALSKGLRCFPIIMHPPTTRNTTGQIDAHAELMSRVDAHELGVNLVSLFTINGIDIRSEWSEDNVHLNGVGAQAIAPSAAPIFRSMAQIVYPTI